MKYKDKTAIMLRFDDELLQQVDEKRGFLHLSRASYITMCVCNNMRYETVMDNLPKILDTYKEDVQAQKDLTEALNGGTKVIG